ncbi:MAG: 23S rRNA (uracil(1939)-C(5))-methyltransferase RlmD [Desulfobulbaceae bacterium]|nr:MAG: 23S rRNA (uracil(1939)-C(5))-methyltransferase RlmD [Desulfobulbaceae bacterium]
MNHEPLVIEKLVVGGLGLAHRADGMVVLLPGVIPAEKVRIRTVKKKTSFHQAEPDEIVEASPHRRQPPCPYFGRCGGCHLQHIAASYQDVVKKDIFCDQFRRSGLLFACEQSRYLAAPQPLGYRQRIRLHVREGRFGFFGRRSHELLAIDACLLARPEINAVLAELNKASGWRDVAEQVNELEVHADPADSSCLLIMRFRRKPRPADRKSLQGLLDHANNIKAVIVRSDEGAVYFSLPEGPIYLHYQLSLAGTGQLLDMVLEAGGFCQVNAAQNQAMVDQLLAWLAPLPRGRVLDLFCGMGNFSIPLAATGMQVIGMDQQRAAIRAARRNRQDNGLACEFRRSAALQGLEELVAAGERFDYVILDPPRSGFKGGSALLAALRPTTIVYVSCDQATLLRDLQTICGQGYRITAITLVDQFCQTCHLEAMVLLTAS